MPMDLDSLKKDLITMSVEDFYVKHILKSRNWYFTEHCHLDGSELIDKIDLFREIISRNFNVSFYSVKMVGSAKVGYSLSPYKDLKQFCAETSSNEASDIDVAIVSDKLYNYYWDKIRIINNKNYYFPNKFLYNTIARSIYKGFLNDKDICAFDDIRIEWEKIVDPIGVALQRELKIFHPVTYRLYRNWEDLREYQLNGIIATKDRLEKGAHNV